MAHRQRIRSLSVRCRWVVAALCTVALLFATVRAGSRYFFCSVMEQVRSEACCQRPAAPESSIEDADCACCHAHWVAPLPNAVMGAGAEHAIGSAPPLAVLPVGLTTTRAHEALCVSRWAIPPRAGPPRETDHVRLMVFLS